MENFVENFDVKKEEIEKEEIQKFINSLKETEKIQKETGTRLIEGFKYINRQKIIRNIQIIVFLCLIFLSTFLSFKLYDLINVRNQEINLIRSRNEFYNQTIEYKTLESIELYSKMYGINKYMLQAFIESDYNYNVNDGKIKQIASIISTLFQKYNVEDMYVVYYGNVKEKIIKNKEVYNRIKK